VNERDLLGDDTVPDYLTSVREGAFYGWPHAYFDATAVRHAEPRKLGQRPELVAKAVPPDVALGAHAAPLGLVFYRRDALPSAYHGGAFVAERGSWNRTQFAGFRVAFVPFANGKPSGAPRDFLTGFLKDPETGEAYGRPAGVAQTPDGALLVADDAGNTIWRVQAR
jgi:glucose/arabinose dehydrogenase